MEQAGRREMRFDAEEGEARMRERECFADVKLLPGAWKIVRVDGRAFTHNSPRRPRNCAAKAARI